MSEIFYIGWDVGAWSCKAASESCDAIVILDSHLEVKGKWRNSLNTIIFNSRTVEDFLTAIFIECGCENLFNTDTKIVMAIDAVLGFSQSFRTLINNYKPLGKGLGEHKTNSYLFRKTEMFLFEKGNTPLSALTHLIGSQSTKAIHIVASFAEKTKSIGIWKSKSNKITFIESYPATCGKAFDKDCEKEFGKPIEKGKGGKVSKREYKRRDYSDAYKCARIAHLFCQEPTSLYQPSNSKDEILLTEGWIWALKNNLVSKD